MDSLIAASARALAAGDALGALKRVALRDDPPALALRGIAMAQLGEHARARELLRLAARGFGAHEELSRARCVVAEAEVALAVRDFSGPPRALAAAIATLEAHADHANALQARLPARSALARARDAAERARVPALMAEVAEAQAALERPAARSISAGKEQLLRLDQVAALLGSGALVVDACRRAIGTGADPGAWQSLARRPILFSLARALAEAWPGDAEREALIAHAFNMQAPDETHRARLRVEIGRLRALSAGFARIEATPRGFMLKPHDERPVAVLTPPIDGDQASLLALLSDGAAWSTSALALALGASQRTVQRALADLEAEGRARSIGKARTCRWLAPPLAGYTTILLLPAALAIT
eukprot:gene37324-46055_t